MLRVAVVTGTRAEYGLLSPLMRILQNDDAFKLHVIATGAHLSQRFGMTVNAILEDGFSVDTRIPLPLEDDSASGIIRAMAAAQTGLAEAIERLEPDVVVLLGDRYEMLAAATAAFVSGVAIAHIHGGETTEGAVDDGFRHAITKLSQLHFVAAEPYRRRVIQMGEAPDRVFNVGALGLDVIEQADLVGRETLMADLGWPPDARFLLMTFHPVTLDADAGINELQNVLAALDTFTDYRVLITGHNADRGHRGIGGLLSDYAAARPGRVVLRASLGQANYVSAMKYTEAVVGNSSSGIIEAPTMRVPTVNIGDRQKGRLRSPSVIDSRGDMASVTEGLTRALSPSFREAATRAVSPYGTPGGSRRIADVLRNVSIGALTHKRFYDLPMIGQLAT
ncbi:MAG: UDP-N-acetylglucosamine 2-epimerase (hydrolyzing) [Pseudolabrys sp.]|nr:UDP-N-acetylglucosamine 2-epimerase (hydrolyzing) [Pseudolabrys sp.]